MAGEQVVVITGAAKGQGAACARRLLRPDRILVLADIDEDGLTATQQALLDDAADDAAVRTRPLDVTDKGQIQALAQEVAALGPLGALLNAAGVSPTMADWQTVLRVDLVGTALLLEAFRPLAVPGTVALCWASSAAHIGEAPGGDPAIDAAIDDPLAPDFLDRFEQAAGARRSPVTPGDAYSWGKRGVIRLAGREAAAWGKRGGRICSISPGIIDTPMGRQEFANQPVMKVMLDYTPVGRQGAPGDIAALAAFLLSPEAGFLSGCDIMIDGGVTATLTHLMATGGLAPPAGATATSAEPS